MTAFGVSIRNVWIFKYELEQLYIDMKKNHQTLNCIGHVDLMDRESRVLKMLIVVPATGRPLLCLKVQEGRRISFHLVAST